MAKTYENDMFGEITQAREMWKDMPEYEHKDLSPFREIKIFFRNEADVKAFAILLAQNITAKTKRLWFPAAKVEQFAHLRYISKEEQS
jgi:hypothetical protein